MHHRALILHQRTKDHRVHLKAQAEQSHAKKKKKKELKKNKKKNSLALLQWEAERCTAAESSQDAADAYKRTEFIMEPPLSIQSPCTANVIAKRWESEPPSAFFCEAKTLQKEKFNLIGWLNDGWSHSRRVVQRAKDKFGWSRFSHILAHCRIAPVEQCIVGNVKQVIGIAD